MTEIVNFFRTDNILFSFMGQNISVLEFISTIAGLLCVFLASRGKVANFVVGYFRNVLLFLMFIQVRAYSSMVLQPITLILTIYGHYRWTHPKEGEKNEKNKLRITVYNNGQRTVVLALVLIFMFIWGYFLSRIDIWFPTLFHNPTVLPYFDAGILGMVLMAQYLSAQKKLDCWGCWLIADAANIILCLRVGFGMMSVVNMVYFILAISGLVTWYREYKKQEEKKGDVEKV